MILACFFFAALPHNVRIKIQPDEANAVLAILDKRAAQQQVGDSDWTRLFATEGYVRLEKRYSNKHQYLLSYTLSKADNFGGGATPQYTDFYNPGLDWGPGSADRRHALVASGSMLLKYDINVGAVWTLRSTMLPSPSIADPWGAPWLSEAGPIMKMAAIIRARIRNCPRVRVGGEHPRPNLDRDRT